MPERDDGSTPKMFSSESRPEPVFSGTKSDPAVSASVDSGSGTSSAVYTAGLFLAPQSAEPRKSAPPAPPAPNPGATNPFAPFITEQPAAGRVRVDSGEPSLADLLADSATENDRLWASRGIDQQLRGDFLAAGLRPDDSELAARCLEVHIGPDSLTMRISGRTVLQRIRDSESPQSISARIMQARESG